MRRVGDREVEVRVDLGESARLVLQRVAGERVECLLDLREIAGRRALGRVRGRDRLEAMAQLEHVVARLGVLQQQIGERAGHDGRRDVRDDEAAAPDRADEAVRLEPHERLAQRRARHVQLRGELALGRQLLAGQQLARRDERLDLIGHHVGQAHAGIGLDRLKRHARAFWTVRWRGRRLARPARTRFGRRAPGRAAAARNYTRRAADGLPGQCRRGFRRDRRVADRRFP
ncbi:transcriptional regulator, GntR family domain protein [Burkholderia pseudomallei]|nr:transcriptional regulator, GntR family domain protein [Burkholderia pseudomallei]